MVGLINAKIQQGTPAGFSEVETQQMQPRQAHIRAKIGNIVFALSADQSARSVWLEQAYQDFLCTDEPEVTIHVYTNGLPPLPLRDDNKIFDSQMVWSLYRVDGCHVFAMRSPVFSPQPYQLAVFDADFRHGEVYSTPPQTPGSPLPNPLEFPLSEVLMICLLAQGRGLMVHACGVEDGGCGYLFAGNSTHGKTTMARLWRDQATILNDDRIVLRQREGRFWMYGTPWHGEYSDVSPQGVPLDRVFFLHHAPANGACRVAGAVAAAGLLTCCFPPLWDAAGMRFTLDFCAQLAAAVHSYDLGFVPDKRIVDLVRCMQ